MRRTLLAVLTLALVIPASAPARAKAQLRALSGLKAFSLSYYEPVSHNFTRTPSFSWKPTSRTMTYEFQLASSDRFRDNSIVWSSKTLTTPYVSVPLALPWTTGHPYSLFARVRAHTQLGVTPWSTDFGFNVLWSRIPAQLPAPNGLLRWTPVDGASGYEVWETNVPNEGAGTFWKKTFFTATNVADMRDWYTFHQTLAWVGTGYWRVRAVRTTYGTSKNGQTSTSYGPWSQTFDTHAVPPSKSRIALDDTVSDVIGTAAKPVAHSSMPGFDWTGSFATYGTSSVGTTELYRTYIFSDKDCGDPVFIGSIVGSPAWAPRTSGALELPREMSTLVDVRNGIVILPDGDQGPAYDDSLASVVANESVKTDATGGTTGPPSRLDLWDRKWPSGAYYWTTVPVMWIADPDSGVIQYYDTETPQDACAAGRIGTFGRVSKPIPSTSTSAYVTSLSLSGRTTSASAGLSPSVYGTPLVTWTSVLGADLFEVQWSRTPYPWKTAGKVITPATSAVLPLKPGVWYYRVRGIDLQMPASSQGMVWSSVRVVRVAKPVFRVG